MEETYLRPDMIPADGARKVLDFLNNAKTPEAIVEATEIPGERDIGIVIAQRIFDRRVEMGAFTDLQQIDDIEQVGPERFTEIIEDESGVRFRR